MRREGSLAERQCHGIHEPANQNANSDVIHNRHDIAVPHRQPGAVPHRTVMRGNPYRRNSFRAVLSLSRLYLSATTLAGLQRTSHARATELAAALAPRIEINSLNLILCQPSGRGTSAGTLHHPTLEAHCRSNPLQQQLPNPSC